MSWKINTYNICKKITSGICAPRRLREFVDKDTLLSVYNAIVQAYFNYCCKVWNAFVETQSTRLEKLHNRAACIIAKTRNEVDQQSALNALGCEPLKAQRRKAKAKIMFKILNNMGQKCLNNLFTYKNELLNYNLRDRTTIVCSSQPRTNNMEKNFMYDGTSIWNSLPTNIRESKSLSCFERKIATHVFRY